MAGTQKLCKLNITYLAKTFGPKMQNGAGAFCTRPIHVNFKHKSNINYYLVIVISSPSSARHAVTVNAFVVSLMTIAYPVVSAVPSCGS